ncbi:hypothetical protein [Reyranella sp.]|uniref:hypothetical protein n=1 Tax=Reyranella sp. TaxID=1929291 RepID=UPI003BACED07
MRKIVVALAIVVVLAAAAVAAVPFLERQAAAEIKRGLERNGTTKVEEVEVGLFDRRVRLSNLSSSNRGTTLTVARWEASGLAWPLDELLRGHTPLDGFQLGDPLRAEQVEMANVRVVESSGQADWSIELVKIDGFDLARFDALGVPEGYFRPAVQMARAMGALTVRRLEERNAVFTLPTGDTVGVGSVVVDGYDRGRIAAVSVTALEATARDGRAPLYRVAEIKAGDVDLTRTIAALSAEDWVPGAPVGRVTADNASATGFSGQTLETYGIALGGANFATTRESDKIRRTRLRVEGFVLAPPLRGLEALKVRLALQTMGLKEVRADFDCNFGEDRGSGEATLGPCELVGPGLGEIKLSGRIVDADAAFWEATDTGSMLSLADSTAALGMAQLAVVDRSLLERGLRALATATGQPLATARANLAREIRRYQPTGVLISQAMTQLMDTVARFIEQGGTLVIDAKPQPPLTFESMERLGRPGADFVSLLGLSATLGR